MPRYDGPSRSIEDLDKAKLETYRQMFHAELGVAAALHYCTEHDLDAPRWLIRAATELVFALLRNEKSRKRGRSCGIVARYRLISSAGRESARFARCRRNCRRS